MQASKTSVLCASFLACWLVGALPCLAAENPFSYTHDDSTRVYRPVRQISTESYAYDDLGRLTDVTYGDGSRLQYAYDAAGNITTSLSHVNLAPTVFRRTAPTDSAEVREDTLRFAWTASSDPEGASILYEITLTAAGTDTSFATRDTSVTFPAAAFGLTSELIEVRWSVRATDGHLDVSAANDIGVFFAGTGSGVEVEEGPDDLPTAFRLHSAYPNPFNPLTNIYFDVASPVHVVLNIYDILGRGVGTLVDAPYAPGRHRAVFDARGLSSGLYFYAIEMDGFRDTKTVVLVK